mmetsp:Transcript_18783/g.44515  ORF Transcript_18783/g.44515 Transcript_18783/m.44515 type:complete len:270 (+) Transcript_18783:199-1008(+)
MGEVLGGTPHHNGRCRGVLGHVEAIATVDTIGITGAGCIGSSLRWSGSVKTGLAIGRRHNRHLMLVVQVLLLVGVNIVGCGIHRYGVMNILLDHGDLMVVVGQWHRMGRRGRQRHLLLGMMRRNHRWMLCLEGCQSIIRRRSLVQVGRRLMDLERIGKELGRSISAPCQANRCGQGLLILPGVYGQLGAVLLEHVGIDVKAEVDPKEEFHLEAVHFRYQDAADLGIIGVVVVGIVEELGRQEDGRYDHSMDIEVGEEEVVPLDEPIDVD